MAEFGVQATQLSAPQGAGSAPLAPVQTQTTGLLENGVAQGIGNIVNIFARGLNDKRKEEAEALKQSVIKGYVQKQQKINDAVRTGGMTPSEAKTRGRALFGEYAAGYSEYIGDIEGAAKALRGNTELGDVEDAVKTQQTFEQAAKNAAQAAGYSFLPGMTPEQERSQVAAHQADLKADAEFTRLTRQHQERRAQGTYDQSIADREMKDLAIKGITEVADTNFSASYDFVRSLSAGVRSGDVTGEEAQLRWDQKMRSVFAQLQAVAGTNPELAAPYRTLFNDLAIKGAQLLDPKNISQELENEVSILINKAKLVALAEPGVREIVATSQLLGQNSQLALAASPIVTKTIKNLITNAVDSGKPVPPVVGNPEVELDTFKFLKKSMSDLTAGKFKDQKTAGTEAKNAIDNVLQQVVKGKDKRGVDAKYLKNAADFFSSAEFGKYAQSNPLDTEALMGAKKAFQMMYEPTILKGVNQAIQTVVKTSTGLAPNRAQTGAKVTDGTSAQFDPSKIMVVFTGAGVSFQFQNPSTNPVEARMEREVLTQLRQAQSAINQVIHIGAHMEGTTNYAKFWESQKAALLPQFFTPEAKKPDDPQANDGKLKFGKESDLRNAAAFTEDELRPDTPANVQRRKEQDIIAIKAELERKNLSPEAKRILEAELKKMEGR
jgi:hypothetical protein